jgi:hypothetical protein
MVSRVVFDIETVGYPFEAFDPTQQEYLLKFADTQDKRDAEVQKLSLQALTAQVIAIGMYNPDTKSGKVFYQADEPGKSSSGDGKVEFSSGDEAFVLRSFWEVIQRYNQYITFNGRSFDCPFIMLRSAILAVPMSRHLMPYRYDTKEHFDLLEQLTFYGATRKFNLDFYCKAFGIKSPKSEGVTGLDMGSLFRDKKFKQIAEYCLRDITATAELYLKWQAVLSTRD